MSQPTDRSATLALGFSGVGHAFSHLLMMLYLTLVLVLEREWGLSYDRLIGVVFWSQVIYGVAALPAGWLGDRWSAPGVMVVFFIGTGLATVAAGLASGPADLTVALAAVGLFSAIYHPVGIAWLVRVAANRGTALGINGVFGSIGIGGAALVAGTLADLWSWRAAFILPGALAAITGVALLICWRLGMISDRTSDRVPDPPIVAGDMIRVFWVLSVTMFLTGIASNTATLVLPKLFETRLDGLVGSTAAIGALVSVVYVFTALAQVAGGRLADRVALKHAYVGMLFVQVPLVAMVATVLGLPLIGVTIAAMVAMSAALPAENLLLARYTPARWRATAFGAKFVLAIGSAGLAVPLVQWVYGAHAGVAPVFYGMAVLLGIAAVVAALLPPAEPAAAARRAAPAE
jgi:MFS family permease